MGSRLVADLARGAFAGIGLLRMAETGFHERRIGKAGVDGSNLRDNPGFVSRYSMGVGTVSHITCHSAGNNGDILAVGGFPAGVWRVAPVGVVFGKASGPRRFARWRRGRVRGMDRGRAAADRSGRQQKMD